MKPRTFRQPSCVMIVGGVIAFVGALIAGIAAYHLATGTPLWQATSKVSGGEHLASNSELWFGILGGLPFLILGFALILSTMNCEVVIDDQGIFATNLLKRKSFQAVWSEIDAIDRIDSSPGSGYKVAANGKTLRIQTSLVHMKDLVAEIQRRAPNRSTP